MTSRRFAIVLLAVFTSGFLAALAGLDVRATYGARVSADEPQYLLTAISLAEDRNLNIDDEIDGKAYLPFSEVGLNRQTKNLTPEKQVSPHDPLLPLLLAAPVGVAGWIGAKIFLAVIAGAVAALTFWVAVRRFDIDEKSAGIVCAVLAASAPFAVYGNQVYPEIVAALCTVSAVAVITARRTLVTGAAVVLFVSALPWLSVKYVPVAAALGAWAVFSSWRKGARSDAVWMVGLFAMSGALFVLGHLAWYGGLTPYPVGDHFVGGEFTVVGSSPDVLGRSRRLIGLMVDDKFGLAAWQPAWLLLFPAVGAALGSRSSQLRWLTVVLGAAWLNATFVALTMQGWWWPGRQVVVALPAATLLIAHWVGAGEIRRRSFFVLGAAGIAMLAALVVEGLQRRVTWIVDFFEVRFFLYRFWQTLLPDYLDLTPGTWVLHSAWLALALGGLALGWVQSGRALGRARSHGGELLRRADLGA